MEELIVSVDIGTSKICTLIGKVNNINQLEILGRGFILCSSIKKGVIVDIESTSEAIKSSVQQAETMSGMRIGSAYVSIAGMHVNIINNRVNAGISGENREITSHDVERALKAVSDVDIPEDMQIIDIVPRQYIIDGYDEILDPIGMAGIRLELDADIVSGKITSVQNIIKSVEKAGVKIDGLIAGAFSAGEIAITSDEKEVGAILIDVGGSITDVSVFYKNRLIFYESIPVGGDHITNDIAIGLKISYSDAEKIKRQYELALTSLISNDQEITITDVNDNRKKSVKISEIVEIIEARVYEIFSLCLNLILKSGLETNPDSTVVLTGGGISYVDGNKQLANEVFELPVRVASYNMNGISKPEYLTAAGIIKHVSKAGKTIKTGSDVRIERKEATRGKNGILGRIIKAIGNFFKAVRPKDLG